MKSFRLITIIFMVIMSISFIAYALSDTQEKPVIVNGHVYGKDGRTPLINATVKVTCNKMIRYDETNSKGFYVTEFLQGCRVGHLVIVESNHIKGFAYVQELNFFKNIVYINLLVPEVFNNGNLNSKPKNHDLKIKSLMLEEDNIKDKLVAYVRIQNQGSQDESNVKLILRINDLDVSEIKTIPILSKDDVRLKVFEIDIPKNSEKGFYSLDAKVFNEYSEETEGIEFRKI